MIAIILPTLTEGRLVRLLPSPLKVPVTLPLTVALFTLTVPTVTVPVAVALPFAVSVFPFGIVAPLDNSTAPSSVLLVT